MQTQQQQTDSRRTYDAFADKIGMVPNVRFKDNFIQGIVVVVFALIGALGGYFVSSDLSGAGYGALAGLISGGFLSGFVLMIVGLSRKRTSEKERISCACVEEINSNLGIAGMNDMDQHKVRETYHQWFTSFTKDSIGVGQNGLILLLVGIPVTLSAVILGFSLFPAGLYPRFILIAPGLLASMLLLYFLGLVLFKGGSIGRIIVAFIGMAALWVSIVLVGAIYQ